MGRQDTMTMKMTKAELYSETNKVAAALKSVGVAFASEHRLVYSTAVPNLRIPMNDGRYNPATRGKRITFAGYVNNSENMPVELLVTRQTPSGVLKSECDSWGVGNGYVAWLVRKGFANDKPSVFDETGKTMADPISGAERDVAECMAEALVKAGCYQTVHVVDEPRQIGEAEGYVVRAAGARGADGWVPVEVSAN